MFFNSLEFWLFFGFVFAAYAALRPRIRAQNVCLLLASYVFYFSIARGFVLLLLATTLFDFWCGNRIEQTRADWARRAYLFFSVLINVALLVFFKQLFLFSAQLAAFFGASHYGQAALGPALPIGISFYTLQSISYVVDVYRRQYRPHQSLLDYALYISFFPQLLAGPIERAAKMIPQFSLSRTITAGGLRDGLWLCLWGLFEKCVVSDNLQARIISPYFAQGPGTNGLASLLVLCIFCMRIYCDFDGYSNIARGLARMMGFDLSVNFLLPGYAVSTKDFWRRFHVTFYQWIRDYVFLPLVKSLGLPAVLALVAAFVVSGLWHQFSWAFVCWGLYQAVIILACELPGKFLAPIYEAARGLRWLAMTIFGIISVRVLQGFAVAFFVSPSVGAALAKIYPVLDFGGWRLDSTVAGITLLYLFFRVPYFLVEIAQLRRNDMLAPMRLPMVRRSALVALVIIYFVVFGGIDAQKFVYFHF